MNSTCISATFSQYCHLSARNYFNFPQGLDWNITKQPFPPQISCSSQDETQRLNSMNTVKHTEFICKWKWQRNKLPREVVGALSIQNVQCQVGHGFEQRDLLKYFSVHVGAWILIFKDEDELQRFLLTQTILWFSVKIRKHF